MRMLLPALALAAFLLPATSRADDAAEDIREFPPRPAGGIDTTADGIAREVRALGDADYQAREAAVRILFWIGEPARAALSEACRSSDAEVSLRAKHLVAMLDRYTSLKDVDVRFMVRGYCLAGTKIEDKKALGGFGRSNNLPEEIPSGLKTTAGALQLIAEPDELVVFGKSHKGMKLIVANTANIAIAFAASDSRISIIQEAQDEKGEWKPIEYLPQSW